MSRRGRSREKCEIDADDNDVSSQNESETDESDIEICSTVICCSCGQDRSLRSFQRGYGLVDKCEECRIGEPSCYASNTREIILHMFCNDVLHVGVVSCVKNIVKCKFYSHTMRIAVVNKKVSKKKGEKLDRNIEKKCNVIDTHGYIERFFTFGSDVNLTGKVNVVSGYVVLMMASFCSEAEDDSKNETKTTYHHEMINLTEEDDCETFDENIECWVVNGQNTLFNFETRNLHIVENMLTKMLYTVIHV